MPRLAAFLPFAACLALFLIAAPLEAATNLDAQNYHKAFKLLDDGHPEHAVLYAVHGRDPVLNKVLRAAYMAHPGNDVSFDDMAEFVANNPDWPNVKAILAVAEQKIPAGAGASQVVNWFTAHPPLTPIGFYRYIDALEAMGQTRDVPQLVRTRWVDGDFTGDELTAFYARFGGTYLDAQTNVARLDRLVWKGDVNGARRMYAWVDGGHRALAEARLALANQSRNAPELVDNVPAELCYDSGLLYEKLRWLRRNNRDDQADEILGNAPDDLDRAESWWEERQIMVRRAMEKRDYNLAYHLAAAHGQTEAKTVVQAEFLAGWLALRFLNNPGEAESHFRAQYEASTTPISRSRGAYWIGRAEETLGNQDSADQAYEDAAALNITYYGQLAATKLEEHPVIFAKPEPAVPASVRNAFFDRDIIRAVERLHLLGENDRTHVFFHAATEAAEKRADFALLMELAYQIHRPDYAIEAAKAANQKNMLMASGGFPVLDRALPRPPEPAFTHALIRQESMFNPNAESPVGAEGLMQLMPKTAKSVARMCGLKYKEKRLCEPDYNLRLGTTFIQQQLNMFNGSYVLALAAYNAGPSRVHEWMNQIGDPRDPNIDPVDWIEMIPVPETRNYVQRIIESLQVYRARLGGGKAPLKILEDLKR
jgi:soluble lytic murein transglycosylase